MSDAVATNMGTPCIFSSWLKKTGGVLKSQKLDRWVELKGHELVRYKKKDGEANGTVLLDASVQVKHGSDGRSFTLVAKGHSFDFRAKTEELCQEWLKHIAAACEANSSRDSPDAAQQGGGHDSAPRESICQVGFAWDIEEANALESVIPPLVSSEEAGCDNPTALENESVGEEQNGDISTNSFADGQTQNEDMSTNPFADDMIIPVVDPADAKGKDTNLSGREPPRVLPLMRAAQLAGNGQRPLIGRC